MKNKKNKVKLISTVLFTILILAVLLIKNPFKIDLIINSFKFPEIIIPFLQFISNITATIPMALATLFLFYILRKNKKKMLTLLLIPFSEVTVNLLKSITARARPNGADLKSFPSGHVTVTTVFCLALYLTIIKDLKNKTIKYILTILAILFPILVAISRIALNEHWLTDVIGGFLLGISVSLMGYSYISNPHKLFK